MLNRLQYISQGETPSAQLGNISQALDGGCKWIQLRFKNATVCEITYTAAHAKTKCTAYGATLIINDHASVAKTVEADGVHLGLTDMTVADAMKILGPDKLIGGTANTLWDVVKRAEEGCHYVGLGPLRFTPTKEKLSPVLGIQGYQAILSCLEHRGACIPIYAIGGIVLDDVPSLLQTGIYGVAVSGLITHHPDKQQLIAQFNSLYATFNHSR
jgi:thiamine-phosphate pyrophosphorylase